MATPRISIENRLGPYRLLRKLGAGGMGDVYLAFDDALDRQVAIKMLRQLPLAGAGEIQSAKYHATLAKRFLREAKSAARVSHPNVVMIHTVGQQGEFPYLVMEYVEGGSLAEHVRRHGPMPWRAAASAMRDALLGLSAAHGRGVIHRDLKPANLMRGRTPAGDDLIKLADFGLARVVAAPLAAADGLEGELTFTGAFVGSPSYASPEQITGARVIDGRADLYSLAATAYALLTGQPPFVEDDPADVLQRHLAEAFPDPRQLSPTAPGALVDVLEKASRKKAEQRYASATAMLAALEKVLAVAPDEGSANGRSEAQTRERPGAASPSRKPPAQPVRTPAPPRADETLAQLESRLASARASHDSTTQIATLRTLHALYSQLDRRPEATRAYQEALVLHIKLHAPHDN